MRTSVKKKKDRRRLMRAVLFLWLLAWTAVFMRPLKLQAKEAFTLDEYYIEMNVRDDNSYLITERFTANFAEKRHGLVRVIPKRTYRNISVEMRDVKANAGLTVSETNNNFELRLGDADTYVEGPVNYEISYVYDIGEDGLRDMDELYFNLIGTDWDTTIDHVSFKIIMPKAFSAEKMNFTWGSKGRTDKAPVDVSISGNVIEGSLKEKLEAYEGLTIALPLPQGYFSGDLRSGVDRWYYVEPFVYLGALLLAAVIGLVVKLGNRRPATVEIYAPADVNPADMSYMYSGEVSNRALSALILHWVNLGYFRMDKIEVPKSFGRKATELLLTPLREPDENMKAYEKRLMNSLNQWQDENGQINLSNLPSSFHSYFVNAKNGVYNYWNSKTRKVYHTGATKALKFFLNVLGLAVVVFAAWRSFEPFLETELAGLSALLLGIFVYLWGVDPLGIYISTRLSKSRENQNNLIISLLAFVILSGILFAVIWFSGMSYRLPLAALALITAMLILIISDNIRILTSYGKERLGQLDGFRNFIKATGHQDVHAQQLNADYFSFNMAYAYAVNQAKRWAKTFAGLVEQQLGAAAAQQWQTYAYNYVDDYDRRMRDIDRTVSRAPASSGDSSSSSGGSGGSSSGGSSGGGSGGGGGRSW